MIYHFLPCKDIIVRISISLNNVCLIFIFLIILRSCHWLVSHWLVSRLLLPSFAADTQSQICCAATLEFLHSCIVGCKSVVHGSTKVVNPRNRIKPSPFHSPKDLISIYLETKYHICITPDYMLIEQLKFGLDFFQCNHTKLILTR